MGKTLGIVLLVIVGIIVLVGMSFAGVYNRIVGAEEGVNSAWAQVENVYQRRADLVPNLVNTVKGYAQHEQETFQSVVEARAQLGQIKISADIVNNPEVFDQFQKAQGKMTSALSRLMAVAERYPDLKANQNFLTLQTQLEGTENRITVERMRFNEAAQKFNTLIRTFPNNIVASCCGHFAKKAYFKADEGAQKAPVVQF